MITLLFPTYSAYGILPNNGWHCEFSDAEMCHEHCIGFHEPAQYLCASLVKVAYIGTFCDQVQQ